MKQFFHHLFLFITWITEKKLLILNHTWTSKTAQSLTSWSLSSMAVAPKSWRF